MAIFKGHFFGLKMGQKWPKSRILDFGPILEGQKTALLRQVGQKLSVSRGRGLFLGGLKNSTTETGVFPPASVVLFFDPQKMAQKPLFWGFWVIFWRSKNSTTEVGGFLPRTLLKFLGEKWPFLALFRPCRWFTRVKNGQK